MKKLIYLLLLLLLFPVLSLAQENQAPPSPKLVDEFGDIYYSDIMARLDYAISEWQNIGTTSRIYIVVYRTRYEPPGKTIRTHKWIQRDLTVRRGIDKERIILIDAGESNCTLNQIWLVPGGTTPKIKEPYQTVIEDKKSVRKFDEYFYALENEDYYYTANSLEEFVASVNKQKGATAYVIVYSQYYVNEWEDTDNKGRKINERVVYRDPANTAVKMQSEIRRQLINKYKLSPAKFRIVDGGYRKSRAIELWIVPRGEHLPVSTPNAFPKQKQK
jgi:hypothetical protein